MGVTCNTEELCLEIRNYLPKSQASCSRAWGDVYLEVVPPSLSRP